MLDNTLIFGERLQKIKKINEEIYQYTANVPS